MINTIKLSFLTLLFFSLTTHFDSLAQDLRIANFEPIAGNPFTIFENDVFIEFSNDGTKMFLGNTGSTRYTIKSYNLTVGYDISTAMYDTLLDLSDQFDRTNFGAVFSFSPDGLILFLSDASSSFLYQYALTQPYDFSSISLVTVIGEIDSDDYNSYSYNSLSFSPDGFNFYLLGRNSQGEQQLLQFSMTEAFDIQTASLTGGGSVNVAGYSFLRSDFASDGTSVTLIGSGVAVAFQFTLSTPWDITTISSTFTDLIISSDIGGRVDVDFSTDGLQMFVSEITSLSKNITQYILTTAYDITTASLMRKSGNPLKTIVERNSITGLTFSSDGSTMYVANGFSGVASQILVYDLSIPYNATSAAFSGQTVDMSSVETALGDIVFSPDGLVLTITGTFNVTSFDLSTPYDLTTYTFQSGIRFSDAGRPSSIDFSVDGLKMYLLNSLSPEIYEYDLSTAFDISTATYNNTFIDISSEGSLPTDISFTDNGNKLLVTSLLDSMINQYDLSTAYDLSSAAYNDISYSTATDNFRPSALYVLPDQSKMLVSGLEFVFEYTIPDANIAPVFTSISSVNVDEKISVSILDVNANDGDGGANDSGITYTLDGTDSGLFIIDATGLLSFVSPPDFEMPSDNGADNVYNLEVIANDGAQFDNTTSQSLVITISDIEDTPPVPDIVLLLDVNAECSATPSAPTAKDNQGQTVTGTSSEVLPITTQGTTVITWTYTDADDNTSTQTQNIVLTDITAPVPTISDLEDFTADCSATPPTPTATDNCSGIVSVTSNIAFPILDEGETLITWTYSDDQGNSVQQQQNIIIADVTGPTPDISVLSRLTDECSVTPAPPTATDACSGAVIGISNVSFPITTQGLTNIIWTYTDTDGNTASQNQEVTIMDITSPVLISNSEVTMITSNINGVTISENTRGTIYSTVITDNCSSSEELTYSLTGSDASLFNVLNGELSFLIAPDFDQPSDVSGNNIYGVNMITADASGNELEIQLIVTVENVEFDPIVIVPFEDISLDEKFVTQRLEGILNSSFSDPDFDVLSFIASSSNESVAAVSIDNSDLIITEVGLGTTNISVSASDGKSSVTENFDFTIINVNDAPIVKNALTDVELVENFEAQTVILSEVFSDEDEDDLTYSAESSDIDLLEVSVDGAALTMSGTGLSGTATVIITAFDDSQISASDEFEVLITNINDAPTIVNPISDVSYDEGFGAQTISITEVFSDEEDDILTFTSAVGDESIVVTSISGGELTLTEVSNGSTNITITADDGNGGTADLTFAVIVNNVNDAPVIVNPIANKILEGGFNEERIAIGSVFFDADEDVLQIIAESSNTEIVGVSINDTDLIITEVAPGNVDIVLTATDGNGGEVSISFSITVEVVLNLPGELSELVLFYPNPVRDVISVNHSGVSKIKINGLSGDLIISKSLYENQLSQINVSDLPSGIYLISIYDKKGDLLVIDRLLKK